MALGDITTIESNLRAIEVLASATATNSPPASATAGVSIEAVRSAFGGAIPEILNVLVVSTAGSGTMDVTIKVWLMYGTLASLSNGAWAPGGTGTGSTKGVINGGVAIDESGANIIRHQEPVFGLHQASRVYFEIVAINGTSTAVTGFLTCEHGSARAR